MSISPADQQIKSFGLFDVTPIGLALIATGILYFMICGRFLLPKSKMESPSAQSMKDYMKRVYGIKADICEVRIPEGNLLIGEAIGDVLEHIHTPINLGAVLKIRLIRRSAAAPDHFPEVPLLRRAPG